MPGLKRSFFRYCVIGAFNMGLSVGLTALLHEVARASEELAYALTLITVFILNFFLSRHYIFSARDGCPRTQFVRYMFSSASFRVLEYLGFLLVHTVIGIYYLAAVIGVQVTSFTIKFFFYRAFVFIGPRPAEPPGEPAG